MGCSPFSSMFYLSYFMGMVWSNGNLHILVVDDSEDDAFFITKALEGVGIGRSVSVVKDGGEAISYLRGEKQFTDRATFPFPNVILSDLKMPGVNGFELLRWIRAHPECSVIPTIVLTGSSLPSDVVEAYRLGASSYMVKPARTADLEHLLQIACEYWSHCERPPALQNC
jgi:CheY-like chemotaxis protein